MSTVEAQSTTTSPAPSAPSVTPGGAAPAPTGAPVPSAPTPVVTAPVVAATPPAPAPAAEPITPPVHKWTGSEDDEIDNGARYELTGSAFRKRMERERRRLLTQLDESSGGDVNKIKERLGRLAEYEAAEEERRQAALTAEQKQAEALQKANERAEAAERRLNSIEEDKVVQREVQRVSAVAAKYIDKDHVDDIVWGPFKKHIASLTDQEVDSMTDDDLDAFFADFVKKKPKFAIEQPAPPAPPPVVEPPAPAPVAKKVGMSSGLKSGNKPTPVGAPGEKTLKPGQPNSMTANELREWKKARGYNF